MSKKLIAVAAAAALALTGLVAAPANATTITDVRSTRTQQSLPVEQQPLATQEPLLFQRLPTLLQEHGTSSQPEQLQEL